MNNTRQRYINIPGQQITEIGNLIVNDCLCLIEPYVARGTKSFKHLANPDDSFAGYLSAKTSHFHYIPRNLSLSLHSTMGRQQEIH